MVTVKLEAACSSPFFITPVPCQNQIYAVSQGLPPGKALQGFPAHYHNLPGRFSQKHLLIRRYCHKKPSILPNGPSLIHCRDQIHASSLLSSAAIISSFP